MTRTKRKTMFTVALIQQIDLLDRSGHTRTAETYRTSLNNFLRFRNGEDLPLEALDARKKGAYA